MKKINFVLIFLQSTCGYKTSIDYDWFNHSALHVWVTSEENARVAKKENGSTHQFQD